MIAETARCSPSLWNDAPKSHVLSEPLAVLFIAPLSLDAERHLGAALGDCRLRNARLPLKRVVCHGTSEIES